MRRRRPQPSSPEEDSDSNVTDLVASDASDNDDDRQSVIGTFGLSEINEVRDGDKLTYRGKWYLDESLVDGKIIIGSGQGYISEISIYLDESGVYAPATAKIIAQNYQKDYKIGCVYIHNTKFEFEGGLNSCIKIVPVLSGGTTNELGGLMYLSEKVGAVGVQPCRDAVPFGRRV